MLLHTCTRRHFSGKEPDMCISVLTYGAREREREREQRGVIIKEVIENTPERHFSGE